MVYNSSLVRDGTAAGCGYFVENMGDNGKTGELEQGTKTTCGGDENQSLQYGDDLLKALNRYVDSSKKLLKGWKLDDSHAAVLDFGNN